MSLIRRVRIGVLHALGATRAQIGRVFNEAAIAVRRLLGAGASG